MQHDRLRTCWRRTCAKACICHQHLVLVFNMLGQVELPESSLEATYQLSTARGPRQAVKHLSSDCDDLNTLKEMFGGFFYTPKLILRESVEILL